MPYQTLHYTFMVHRQAVQLQHCCNASGSGCLTAITSIGIMKSYFCLQICPLLSS